jgi:hypothetical protein
LKRKSTKSFKKSFEKFFEKFFRKKKIETARARIRKKRT